MRPDEFVSLACNLSIVIALFFLVIQTGSQAYERWGLPLARRGKLGNWALGHRKISVYIKHYPEMNGRWKLDWAVCSFLLSALMLRAYSFYYILTGGRKTINWTSTYFLAFEAVAALFVIMYVIHEREAQIIRLKDKEEKE